MELLYLFKKINSHFIISWDSQVQTVCLSNYFSLDLSKHKTQLQDVTPLSHSPARGSNPPSQCHGLSQLPRYCKAHPSQTEYIYNSLQELTVATLLNCVQFALPPPPPGVYFHLVGIALLRLGSRRPRSHKITTGTRLPSCPHLPNIYAAKVNVILCMCMRTTCSAAHTQLATWLLREPFGWSPA